MDDQNQTNQPLDQSMSPNVSGNPEDITPKDTAPLSAEPVSSITSITAEPSAPLMAPAEPVIPSEPVPSTEPMGMYTSTQPVTQTPSIESNEPVPPVATTEMPGVTTPSPIPGEQPEQSKEPTLPSAKPKRKILPVIGGVIALVLVAGVAGAAYYVSNQLSTRQAVAPTAPESKPMAAEGAYCDGNPSGCGSCYPVAGSCVKSCSKCGKVAGNWWVYCSDSECEDGGGGTCSKNGTFTYGKYPNDLKYCDYRRSDQYDGDKNCESQSCTPYKYGCGIYCFDTACGADACGKNLIYPACGDADNPKDLLAGGEADGGVTNNKKLTFSKAGKITLFTRSMAGTVTLTGPKTVTITSGDSGPKVKQATTFNVNANETYTINVKLQNETQNSWGWIKNKAASTCGPVKTPGEPLDAKNNPTGKCGVDTSISELLSIIDTNTYETAGISAGGVGANIQCWGDAIKNDATQDYDFNDFTLVFAYDKTVITPTVTVTPTVTPAVGACTEIKIYKKENGVYGTTPLTKEQLNKLSVGDVLKLQMKTSIPKLQGKFSVFVNNEVDLDSEWGVGPTGDNNWTLISYEDYTVSKPGSYRFEGIVTTTP